MARTTKKKAGGSRRTRKAPEPVGLLPSQTRLEPTPEVAELCSRIEEDGGAALFPYREPLGAHWVVLAVLPLEQVAPTPFQRDLSDAHLKRLSHVISKTGRFLDPVIAVRTGPRSYQTPNGHHRVGALRAIGARSVTALVATEPEVARLILALNVEKAHNLREKSMEALRLARDLAGLPTARESDFELEFEEPSFLTLGLCYEARGRFGGGAYQSLLRRCDALVDESVARALEIRQGYATRLLAVDERVSAAVAALKAKGLDSPYLRNFVVARINPLRFRRGASLSMEALLEELEQAVGKFDPDRINVSELARSGGTPADGPE